VSVTLTATADRVRRLADTLAELKERARAAVAGEAGQAVGDAVRDLLTAALAGLLPAAFADPHRPGPGGRWGDEGGPARDPWADRDDEDDWRDADREHRPTSGATSPAGVARWPAALALGAGVVRWWAARRVPTWTAVGIGLLAGAAALAGGPLARAGLALLAAAADLIPLASGSSAWAGHAA